MLALLALAIGSPTAIYNAIIEEMRSGNLATACVQAADLAKSHPTFFGGFHLLGICETQRGKLEAASLQFQRCLDLNPRYIDARVNLANNLLRLGRDNEAARQFGAVLKVNPGHLSSLTNMAALERNRGRPCDAAIYLRRANSLARQEAAITVSLAEALLGCGQAAEAERLLRPLETAYSSNARWNALAGEAAYRIGQPKPAMARLRRALELDPKVQRYWMIAGELLLASESDRAAAAFFETGLKNLPDSPALHTGLAVAYLAGGARTEDALVHLEQALALESGFEPALLALCRAAEQVRDAGRLEAVADRWRRINPRAWQPDYFQAIALLLDASSPQGPDPAQLLGRAIVLNSRAADPHVALGKLLLSRNEPAAAVRQFELAAPLNPDDAPTYYHLAQAYRRLGDSARSAAALAEFNRRKSRASDWKVSFRLAPASP